MYSTAVITPDIATYYRLDGRDDKDQMADPWFAAYAPPCARAETDKRWSVKTKPSSIPRNTRYVSYYMHVAHSDGSPLSPNRDNSLFPTVCMTAWLCKVTCMYLGK